ncbi:MAG: type IV secretion system protein VirB10 [Steroidobacteraceae bacterium]
MNRPTSLHSRLSSVLAMTLMSVLGLGSLTWYYANTMTRQSRARQSAQSASASHAQGEMTLPSLGRIDPPLPPAPPTAAAPLESTIPSPGLQADPIPLTASTPPPKSPAEIALERQLSGAVFGSQSAPSTTGAAPPVVSPPPGSGALGTAAHAADPGELSALLRPGVAAAVHAQMLPAQRLLLPKGAFIDCTLETAIDSTLPGMTTCVMATDAFGVDGKVVLLERGTKLIGETRGQVQQGAARIFVLWTEARTPTGVIVPLASPGADELGRSGLPGEVNTHFWDRFGAALLVSVVDGAVTAAAQSTRNSSGTVVIEPSASQGVLTEILKSTVNIPPTVVKHNGDRIQVLVARDLDFRSVYELRSITPGR